MDRLLHSSKFMLLVLDTIIVIALYSVEKYAPGSAADVKFYVGALQPVFIALIASIAHEDAAEKRATITHDFVDSSELTEA
jgi:hypothetical protein